MNKLKKIKPILGKAVIIILIFLLPSIIYNIAHAITKNSQSFYEIYYISNLIIFITFLLLKYFSFKEKYIEIDFLEVVLLFSLALSFFIDPSIDYTIIGFSGLLLMLIISIKYINRKDFCPFCFIVVLSLAIFCITYLLGLLGIIS